MQFSSRSSLAIMQITHHFPSTMMRCCPLVAISCLLFSLHALCVEPFSHSVTPQCKTLSQQRFAKPSIASEDDDAATAPIHHDTPIPILSVDSLRRRQLLLSALASSLVLTQFPQVSNAGEVGARITKTVTTSDLGIAVRESVVRGAQTMDKLDGQWEQFSDRFGLGAARKQQSAKPIPKVIPDPLPLDSALAERILEIADQVREIVKLAVFRLVLFISFLLSQM